MRGIEVTTGAEMQVKALSNQAEWLRRERRYRGLLSFPIIGRLFTRRYRTAWREVEYAERIRQAIKKHGAENLSGMDLTIIGLGVPDSGASHGDLVEIQ